MFQQYSAPAHRALASAELLSRETSDFIMKPNLWPQVLESSPVDYRILAMLHERIFKQPVRDVDELKQRLIDSCQAFNKQ